MCIAVLDPERLGWTREDWKTYNKEDAEFAETFKNAMCKGNVDEIDVLIEIGKGYYHFPNIGPLQILFVKDMDFYLSIMQQRDLFYKYDSISYYVFS